MRTYVEWIEKVSVPINFIAIIFIRKKRASYRIAFVIYYIIYYYIIGIAHSFYNNICADTFSFIVYDYLYM